MLSLTLSVQFINVVIFIVLIFRVC